MRSILLAVVIGALCFHAGTGFPHAAVTLACALCAAAALRSFPALSAFICGFLIAAAVAQAFDRERWPPSRHGETVSVSGTVASLPDRAGRGARFIFRPDPGHDLPRRVRVGWWSDDAIPEPGSRWRLALRMQSPRGLLNPAGFDHERWLAARRISATATVRTAPPPQRLEPPAHHGWLAWRAALDRHLAGALDGHARAGIIRGLVLGERGDLDRHAWEVFARTGTAHLMAISGLHVGMVASLAFLLARLFTRRLSWGRECAVLGGLLAGGIYAALAGFAVPTRRATFMLAAVALQLCLRRQSAAFGAWTLALAAVVVTDPLSPLTIGFWLSFGAVAVIAWTSMYRRAQPPAAVQLVRVQWAVSIGLLPATLWFFQRGSLVAPLVNLAAVPVFSMLVVPVALSGALLSLLSPPFGTAMLSALAQVLDVIWLGLEWAAARPWAQRFSPRPPLATVLVAFFGVIVLLAPGPGWFRICAGAALCAPMLAWSPASPSEGGWRLALLDVGQGHAAVIHTANHIVVFDTGPSFGPHSDAGVRIVVPYLRAAGVRRLDTMVLSHPHDDHDGGARSVLDAFPQTAVLVGSPDGAVTGIPCRGGQAWMRDGVRFRVLHPTTDTPTAPNLVSCVLQISGDGGSLLLTGDIEWPAELELSVPGRGLEQVDVVVVPHHGSTTSSIPRLVQRTQPRWALVPAGFGNRWGFPDAAVVGRWESAGAEVRVVGAEGAIVVDAPPGGPLTVTGERSRRSGWWRVE